MQTHVKNNPQCIALKQQKFDIIRKSYINLDKYDDWADYLFYFWCKERIKSIRRRVQRHQQTSHDSGSSPTSNRNMPRTSTGKTSTPTWRTPIKELQRTTSDPMTPTPVKPAVASAQHFQPINAFKHAPLDLSSLRKSALRLRSETPHHSHD